MNGDEQVRQDEIEQEQRRQFAAAQLKDRAKQSAKTMASKAGMEKFEKALGKGAKNIKVQKHGMAAWVVAIILAVAKDLLDIGTIELASGIDWIVDIVIGVSMFFLFGRSLKLTRKLITSGGAMIAEMIPGVGFLPVWTLAVVYMYLKSEQGE